MAMSMTKLKESERPSSTGGIGRRHPEDNNRVLIVAGERSNALARAR